MPSSLPLRHLRRLCTAPTISQAKTQLQSEHNPDKAFKIYSSVSDRNSSPSITRYAQDLTIRRLAKSRRFSDIESLLESHKSDPSIKQEHVLSSVLRSYALAGMFDHVLKTYDQMDSLGTPRTSLSFNSLLSACAQMNFYDKVPVLFSEMPEKYGFLPDSMSYGVLVKAYCEMGMVEKAMECLREMEKKNVEVGAIIFTTILSCLYKKGNVDEAEKIWNEMVKKGCNVDVVAYNVKIGFAQDGKPEKIKGLIEEIKNSGLIPNAVSYNYLMTCYFRNGVIEEGKKIYNGMIGRIQEGEASEKIECKPNATTFRSMIYYMCRNEDYETGYEVFKDSVKANRIPNFRSLYYLVAGLVKEEKVKEAKELIRTIRSNFPANLVKGWAKVEKNLGLDSTDDDAGNGTSNSTSEA